MTRKPLLAAVSALSLFAAAAPAPAQSPATQPATAPAARPSQYDRALTVSPAAADGVAGSFAYSQQTLDLRDENAAPLYLQAFIMAPDFWATNGQEWNEVYYDQSPQERDPAAVEALLKQYQTAFEICEPAVRRTWSDFGSPLREKGISTLLPYLNQCRMLANAMDLSVDYQRLGGNHDAAEEMTRRLFVLGRHVGNARQPLLVDGLVGVGIAAMAAKQASQLAEMPGAPNRYWAVATLPQPMFDTAAWLTAERWTLRYTFPALRAPESITAERLGEILVQMQMWGAYTTGTLTATPEAYRRAVATFTISLAGAQFLRDRGYTDDQIVAAERRRRGGAGDAPGLRRPLRRRGAPVRAAVPAGLPADGAGGATPGRRAAAGLAVPDLRGRHAAEA